MIKCSDKKGNSKRGKCATMELEKRPEQLNLFRVCH